MLIFTFMLRIYELYKFRRLSIFHSKNSVYLTSQSKRNRFNYNSKNIFNKTNGVILLQYKSLKEDNYIDVDIICEIGVIPFLKNRINCDKKKNRDFLNMQMHKKTNKDLVLCALLDIMNVTDKYIFDNLNKLD